MTMHRRMLRRIALKLADLLRATAFRLDLWTAPKAGSRDWSGEADESLTDEEYEGFLEALHHHGVMPTADQWKYAADVAAQLRAMEYHVAADYVLSMQAALVSAQTENERLRAEKERYEHLAARVGDVINDAARPDRDGRNLVPSWALDRLIAAYEHAVYEEDDDG